MSEEEKIQVRYEGYQEGFKSGADHSSKASQETIDLFDGLKSLLEEKFNNVNEKLIDIKTQTTKTNGRVRSLEVWRGVMVGGMSILTLLVVPIVLMAISNFIQNK